jgi:hypothetical protein
MFTLIIVRVMFALMNDHPMRITVTDLPSHAAMMAATVNTDVAEPVREDKVSYNSFSC